MRITSKGQVTIPQAIREQAGLLPNTEVDFVLENGSVRLIKSEAAAGRSRGARAVRQLRARGARVRMSTDEILALTRGDR